MDGSKYARVLGDGIVGLTTAQILMRGGWQVSVETSANRASRPIVLQEQTWLLLNDIWECDVSMLCPSQRILGRRTDWSDDQSAQYNTIAGLSLDSASLAAALEAKLLATDSSDVDPYAAVFDARGFTPDGETRRTFGERLMYVWPHLNIGDLPNDLLEIAAGDGFWLIVVPIQAGHVSLQLALPADEIDYCRTLNKLLKQPKGPSLQTERLKHLFEQCLVVSPLKVPIGPGINLRPALRRHHAIGGNSMNYDPICGDGTGQGIKSAILAIAVENSVPTIDYQLTSRHVRKRQIDTFKAHLQQCEAYYQLIRGSAHWRLEALESKNGVDFLNALKVPAEVSLTLSLNPPPQVCRWSYGPRLVMN